MGELSHKSDKEKDKGKSRKFTIILTSLFLFIIGISIMIASAFIVSNIDTLNIQSILEL